MYKAGYFAAAGLVLSLTASLASASVLAQNTGGTNGVQTEFFGQAFTTPTTGGPFTGIEFSFYADEPPTTAAAGGTAFLLTQQYLGSPGDLGAGTPGFLGESTSASGGAYIFDPTLALMPGTTYYLYENAPITTSGGNAISGGQAYFSLNKADVNDNTIPFTTARTLDLSGLQSSNFVVTAADAPTATPEPGSLMLVGGMGLLGLALAKTQKGEG
jgi:hypothetical protein